MTITNNTMNIMVYEIFQTINDLIKTDKPRAIDLMRNNRSRVVLEGYLRMNYDPSVVFQLPPGQAPFKQQKDVPDGYCLTDLKQEFRRMRVFTDAELNLSRIRREQLWLQMCEGLFWKEATLINKIKDRRITDLYDQMTVEFVRETYPDLLPEVVADPVPDELIAPVEYGDDPSKISEAELIKHAIAAELAQLALENTPKKAKADVKKKVATTSASQRKKPGPKPKAKVPAVPLTKNGVPKKKPGPKPKA